MIIAHNYKVICTLQSLFTYIISFEHHINFVKQLKVSQFAEEETDLEKFRR